MGVKHVEQIKSFVLFLLVGLSLVLTFSIWSYKPNYKTIEVSKVEQTAIGKHKELYEVVKPYRIITSEDSKLVGTVENTSISDAMKALTLLEANDLKFVQSNLNDEEINMEIKKENRMTLFFSSEVPIITFNSIMKFSQKQLPEVTFNRLIIDWSDYKKTNILRILFISDKERTMYSTNASMEKDIFNSILMKSISKAVPYTEYKRDKAQSLYIPLQSGEFEQYIYKVDEISPETFKNALFKDPRLVKKNIESDTSTKYTDAMSVMTADSGTKTINYVYPAAESIDSIKLSELLQDSFNFVNEHGGMTGDFRYSYSNVSKHITEYQLYLDGLPVFSSVTTNRISTIWGDNQIFTYKRPFFQLDMIFSSKKVNLPDGKQMIESLQNVQEVDDIVIGYYLIQSSNKSIYTLEPSWFIIREDSWTRLTSESMGGIEYGLE